MNTLEQANSEYDQVGNDEAEAQEGMPSSTEIDSTLEAVPELQEKENRKRGGLIALIIVLAIVLLAGAAFVGARLLNKGTQQTQSGPQIMEIGSSGARGGGGPAMKSMRIEVEPAKEIPTRQSDMSGMVTEIKDKSIMMNDSGKIAVSIDESGEVTTTTDQNSPSKEVVITADTELYRDATFDTQMPQDGKKTQQIVEPFDFSAIEKNNFISVWGYQRGDRLIAEVILYMQPVRIGKPE